VIGIDLSRRKLDIALLIDGKNEKRIMKADVLVARGVEARSEFVALPRTSRWSGPAF